MAKNGGIHLDLDLDAPGRAVGAYVVPHSDDTHPFGFSGPIAVINGRPGPTLTVIGGVHGDEYQGPILAARLYREIDPAQLTGRLILLPALNTPALAAGTRCSPLDGANLNRAFQIPPPPGPTGAIAAWLEAAILPISQAVLDIHAGGKASIFAPVAMIDPHLDANRALAEAFALPLIWELGALNSGASVNAAAARAGVAMMACELGGAGGTDRQTNLLAHRGVLGVMAHLGMGAEGCTPQRPAFVYADLPEHGRQVRARVAGLFEPAVEPGEDIAAGQVLGSIADALDLARDPVTVRAAHEGILVSRLWRSRVLPGETVATILRKRLP
ncbi:MAG: succinylglutamate desuccinylase/aspartoacylase family protein [Pseudomonadota bacterium]